MSSRGPLDGDDPEAMIKALRGRVSSRKWRLLAVALCRHVYPAAKLTAPRRDTVEVVERFADGAAKREDLAVEQGASLARLARASADVGWNSRVYEEVIWGAAQTSAYGAASTVARQVVDASATAVLEGHSFTASSGWTAYHKAETLARGQVVELIREVCGHAGREAAFDAAWRTPEVRALAGDLYSARAAEGLAYIGDALEEAGCADAELLGHLRGGGRHVRGCWALDLALGRE